MRDKDPAKSARQRTGQSSASSEDFPVSSSHTGHPGDYSYVELVSDIQHRLGRLSEAVENLKTESASQGKKLSDIGQDIHAAKVTLKIVGTVIAALLAFAGWIGNKAVDSLIHDHQQAQSPATRTGR